MPTTRKVQIDQLCKKIASDYEGWEYVAKAFKNKELPHTLKVIDFSWSGSSVSIASQPVVGIINKRVERIWKRTGKVSGWTQFLKIMKPESNIQPYRNRIKDLQQDNAEGYIREVLDIGISMLENNWDFSSEESLLWHLPVEKWPVMLEEDLGTRYCIAKMLVGDFKYIEDYYRDEIETVRPKRKADLEKIMASISEDKTLYEKKGPLYRPQ